MLYQKEINLGLLLVIVGFGFGMGLVALGQVLNLDDLIQWGCLLLVFVCTYTLHRGNVCRDQRMRDAFDMGRNYERGRALTSVH